MFQSETTNESRDRAARIGVKVGVKSIFDVDVTNDVNTSESSMNYSKKLSYRTRGGDPSKGLVGELNLDQDAPKLTLQTGKAVLLLAILYWWNLEITALFLSIIW